MRTAAKTVFAAADLFLPPVKGPRILIYHQVGTNLGRQMEVSTEAFIRQLDWMQEHGEIVDLDTALGRWKDPDSDRLFVLSFDDGFVDFYRNGFPLLAERHLPFTLYLTTEPIESGLPLDPRFPDARPLSWRQVSEMAATGLVTIGAHTNTHPNLRLLRTADIEHELDTSNELISRRTGVHPRHFAYPWGWWSSAADRAVRLRYESAVVGDGPAGDSDIHRTRRLPVQRSDGVIFFKRRMIRGLRVEARVRDLLT